MTPGKDLIIELLLTLVISKSKGLSEYSNTWILRNIHTSTLSIDISDLRNRRKNKSNTTFHKWICHLTSEFHLFATIFLHLVLESCLKRDQIFTSRWAIIRDKRSRDNESWLHMTCLHKTVLRRQQTEAEQINEEKAEQNDFFGTVNRETVQDWRLGVGWA